MMTEEESYHLDQSSSANMIPSSEDLIAEAYAAVKGSGEPAEPALRDLPEVASTTAGITGSISSPTRQTTPSKQVGQSSSSYSRTYPPPQTPPSLSAPEGYPSASTSIPGQYAPPPTGQPVRKTTRQQAGADASMPTQDTTYNRPSGSPQKPAKTSGFNFLLGLVSFLAAVIIIPTILIFSEGGSCSSSNSSNFALFDFSDDSSNDYVSSYKPNTIETELVRVGSEITGFVDIPASFVLDSDESAEGGSLRYVDSNTGYAVVLAAYPQEEGVSQRDRAERVYEYYNTLDGGHASIFEGDYSTEGIESAVDKIYGTIRVPDSDDFVDITQFYFTTSDGIVRSISFEEYIGTSYYYQYKKGNYGSYFSIVSMMYSFGLRS